MTSRCFTNDFWQNSTNLLSCLQGKQYLIRCWNGYVNRFAIIPFVIWSEVNTMKVQCKSYALWNLHTIPCMGILTERSVQFSCAHNYMLPSPNHLIFSWEMPFNCSSTHTKLEDSCSRHVRDVSQRMVEFVNFECHFVWLP